MYPVLIAVFLLLTVTEPAQAGQRQDIFRHAKAATVLIVGVNDTAHNLSLGSGFFVDANGLLVTNAHVIEESARLYVYVLDREIYAAPEVVAVDPDLDLAVLRIPSTWADPLALAEDTTPEGTEVIAVGYPRITDILQMGFTLHASIIPARKKARATSGLYGSDECFSSSRAAVQPEGKCPGFQSMILSS